MLELAHPFFALALTLAVGSACGATQAPQESPQPAAVDETTEDLDERAKRLAHDNIIVDGHIDLPMRLHAMAKEGEERPDVSSRLEEGDFDAVRAKEGGLDAPFMSIYIPAKHQEEGGAKKLADELIDRVEGLVKSWPDSFALAATPYDVEANFDAGKVTLLMGIENGAALEEDLANVEHFFKRGVRYITLTHSKDNLICDSSYDDAHRWQGLSPYGEKVVREMNRVGIMIDISHVSDQAFYRVLDVSTKPVIASHSSLRHFTPGFERNMDDDMVRALADNGGVVMINFGSSFISQAAVEQYAKMKEDRKAFTAANPKASDAEVHAFMEQWMKDHPFPYATVEDVANHIDRVVQLVGIDYVGLGSDFDGVGDSLPEGLKDASYYPNLFKSLLQRGYSDEDIAKLASGNLMRVWRAQNNSR